jgi:hypothetical protein
MRAFIKFLCWLHVYNQARQDLIRLKYYNGHLYNAKTVMHSDWLASNFSFFITCSSTYSSYKPKHRTGDPMTLTNFT